MRSAALSLTLREWSTVLRSQIATLKTVGDQHIDAVPRAVLACLQDSLAAAVVTQIVLVIGRIGVWGSAYP